MKKDEEWQIVAQGAVVEGKDQNEVREVLRSKFHFSDDVIAVLLSGRQRNIKKGLSQAAARKYEQSLMAAGVKVTAQRLPDAIDALSSSGFSLEPLDEDEARTTGPEESAQTARAMGINKRQVLEDAVAVSPGTYHVRDTYMTTITPKWGGSFHAVESFADEAVRYLQHNPALWRLKGRVHQEKGNRAWMKQDCDGAISHYSDALEYGIDPDWLNQRAYCLARDGKYEQALADINRTLR